MKKVRSKLPLFEKILWGLGGFSEQIAVNGLNNLFVPIYNIGYGLDSILIGWAISIPRFFDMVSDPIIGNMSDNCRSRLGRRRPYILWGGILMALIFGLTYMASPGWSSWVLFGYAVVSCILFYLAYTAYSVPYTALGLEMTDDYDERADVQKYRMVFGSVATFTIPWFYMICLSLGMHIRQVVGQDVIAWYDWPFRWVSGMAADPGIKPEVLGVRYLAWFAAGAIVLTILPVFFNAREKAVALTQEKINLLKSAKMIGGNRSFLIQCGMIFLVIMGMFFVNPLLTYLNIFHVCNGDKLAAATWTGWNGTVLGLASLISSFLIPMLVRMFDKKKVLIGGILIASLSVCSTWIAVNPQWPALQLIPAVAIGFGMSCCWLLNGAFIADICDEDELKTGFRREGMFSAVFGFVVKMAFTLIALLLGYLLNFIGYEAGADSMALETIYRLRLFLALFPAGCLMVAALIFSRYPLTRGRVMEIQEKIREKKLNQEKMI
jgi:GPH family glycoside/pentoside/hexuronide:cation symporter